MSARPPVLPGIGIVVGLAAVDLALGAHGLGAAAVGGGAVLVSTLRSVPRWSSWIAVFVHAALALTFAAQPGWDPSGGASGWLGGALSVVLVGGLAWAARWQRRRADGERAEFEARIDHLDAKRVAAEGESRLRVREFAMMSHEIRTPLNGIIGMVRLIRDEPLPASLRSRIALLHSAAESLLRIVNDVVDLGRIEAGKLEIVEEPFDLEALARDVVELASATAQMKNITVAVDLDESLTRHRKGDAGRIRQICVNLIHNAIKFTHFGSVTLVVRALPNDEVRLAVRDTGAGMDAEKAHDIFKTYAKAGGAGGGAGLGLAIVRELVTLMGGRMSVETNLGFGSVFACIIPLPPGPVPSVEVPEHVEATLEGLRVLVADDNPVNRMVAVGQLAKAGATAEEVDNGRAAYDRVLDGGIDVVLMDVEMPEMTGFEATRGLREAGQVIPIIGLTAHVGNELRQRCFESGMNEHLAKPFKPGELVAAIQRGLRAS